MKLPLLASIPALLAALTTANYLDQNAVCGDNKECTRDCQDGAYHIVADIFHLVNFGCSRPPSPGPVTYASPDCAFGLGDVPDETAKSRATCETVGGTLCRHTYRLEPKFVNNCIVSTADVGTFQTGCEAAGGTFREGNRGLSFGILTNDCKAD